MSHFLSKKEQVVGLENIQLHPQSGTHIYKAHMRMMAIVKDMRCLTHMVKRMAVAVVRTSTKKFVPS